MSAATPASEAPVHEDPTASTYHAEPAEATSSALPAYSSPLDAILAADPAVLAVSIALPLLLIFFFFLRPGKVASGGRSLLLFGPVGGGKTALYHQIRFGRVVPTVSSMELASSSFVPQGHAKGGAAATRPIHAIDVPGTGRLRARLLKEAAGAACLVCVLDGTRLAAQAREAAQLLFDVLSSDMVARRMPPLLVCINKVDAAGAATVAAARKALEQEIPRIRLARTTMEDTAGRAKPPKGGIADDSEGGAFSFDQLGNAVQFVATSATKPDVGALVAFAIKHAR